MRSIRCSIVLAGVFGAFLAGCSEPVPSGGQCAADAECAIGLVCRDGRCGVPDLDGDGRLDGEDNCPEVSNPDQKDSDGDGLGDLCDPDDDNDGDDDDVDLCPFTANADQKDTDGDGLGDACDTDRDGDEVPNDRDNCPDLANRNQADRDHDGTGDACDDDRDGDNIDNAHDNCPDAPNEFQQDLDDDGIGDACDASYDDDHDGIGNPHDNCPRVANQNQADADQDGIGDACDADGDGDGTDDDADNCPDLRNPDQKDTDNDGLGDACDGDVDGDTHPNEDDNCPDLPNGSQADGDRDGAGDVCDSTGVRGGGPANAECKRKIRVPFSANLKWSWPGTQVLPTALANKKEVMMTPTAADLDGDGVTEIVFVAHSKSAGCGGQCLDSGAIVSVDGRTGAIEVMAAPTGDEPAGAGQIAIGNLDNSVDGKLEIVTLRQNGGVVIYRNDGTVLWSCKSTWASNAGVSYCDSYTHSGISWGGPALVNLDADAEPEIVYGASVLDRRVVSGTPTYVRLWKGTAGAGDNGVGPLSVPVDLDLDGTPEIVTALTAYRANGTVYWDRSADVEAEDGFVGVANFDADANPEIAVVSNGNVWVLQHTGTVLWGPVPLPVAAGRSAGRGGAPTVADFDGDGRVEIGVATRGSYVVYDTDGTVLWQRTTQDFSSSATGSSVFDFEGDGWSEVVYNDEKMMRVYDGETGAILLEVENPTATGYEYPIIANVDADAAAELVVGANPYGTSTKTGLSVYGNANWVATRKIWNQHAYSVTNVTATGTVPTTVTASWRTGTFETWPVGSSGGTFRANASKPPAGVFVPAADLQISGVDVDRRQCAAQVTVRLWVDNFGNATAPAGVEVNLYAGAATAANFVGTVRTMQDLAPGQSERISFVVPGDRAAALTIIVDEADVVPECASKANNMSSLTGAGCE